MFERRIVMSLVYLELLRLPGNYNAEKGLLDTARAYIALKQSLTAMVNRKEFTTISEECRTAEEIEARADCLIEELKTIKKQAAAFFNKEKENRQRMADKSRK
jgi:hypothetical protein